MADDARKIPLSFLGVKLTGSRLSADSYLDLLAIVYLATRASQRCEKEDTARLLEAECERYGRDVTQVCARVALYFGPTVPEVEEP